MANARASIAAAGAEIRKAQAELARLTTERDAAMARTKELEEAILVRDRAIKVANDSVERVDRILASWHKVFPVDDPVIARRMVEDRAHAERDAEKVMTDEMYRGQRAAQEAQAAATERARVAKNERDAAQAAMIDGALREADLLARAERAERVAVWAMRVGAGIDELGFVFWRDAQSDEYEAVRHDGTDAGIYRALVEACEGGES